MKHPFRLCMLCLALFSGLTLSSCGDDDDNLVTPTEDTSTSSSSSDSSSSPTYTTCTTCGGTGLCTHCKGAHTCSQCSGKGYIGSGSFKVRCSKCLGKGTCYFCTDGKCTTCNGTGRIQTSSGSGTGGNSADRTWIAVSGCYIVTPKLDDSTGDQYSFSGYIVKTTDTSKYYSLYSKNNFSSSYYGLVYDNDDTYCGGKYVGNYTYKTTVYQTSTTFHYYYSAK